MTPRITTCKHRFARGKAHSFDVCISEPGRIETYSIVAETARQAVDIARGMFDGHPIPPSMFNRIMEAA